MRRLTTLLLFTLGRAMPQTSDEKDAIATVQKTFDGMAAHDAAIIRSTMLPDARLYSIATNGTPVPGTTVDDFATRISSMSGDLVEQFTREPGVMIRGRMAQVWG